MAFSRPPVSPSTTALREAGKCPVMALEGLPVTGTHPTDRRTAAAGVPDRPALRGRAIATRWRRPAAVTPPRTPRVPTAPTATPQGVALAGAVRRHNRSVPPTT